MSASTPYDDLPGARRLRGLTRAGMVGALVLGCGSALAEEGRFPPYRPLSAADLVTERIRFRDGVPLVSVGIIDGAPTVEVTSPDGPVRLMLDEQRTPKTVYAPAGARFRFRLLQHRPARRRWWARVATYDEAEIARARVAAERWADRFGSERVRVARAGGLFAVRGRVLDTRAREVLVGGASERGAVEKLIETLYRDEGVRAVLRPTLEARATGRIAVEDARGRRLHVAADRVYVGAVDGAALSVLAWSAQLGGERSSRRGSGGGKALLRRGPEGPDGAGRRYPGHLYVTVGSDGGLAVVASIDAEILLQGVVPAEIFASAPAAALEAQAVVARGAVLSMLGHRHHDAPYHLCDQQHCQVYQGLEAHHPATDRAVRATSGALAVRPRLDRSAALDLVASVYSSSCGGHGAANETVWDQRPSPSLRPRLDGPAEDEALAPFRGGITPSNLRRWVESTPPTYCGRASFARPEAFRWRRVLEGDDLRRRTGEAGVGPLTAVEVLGRGPGGRVTGVRVRGEWGSVDVLRELPVRRMLGLRSGAFAVDEERDDEGRLVRLAFTGAGWGHGVGLCQMGAIGRAEAGHSAEDILGHYYSGAIVERLYGRPDRPE